MSGGGGATDAGAGGGATDAGLFAPKCSISTTRRKRFVWALWTSGPPTPKPFRAPDRWNGGARTREEARAEATAQAGRAVVEIEDRWARAWLRVHRGHPAWVRDEPGTEDAARPRRPAMESGAWPLVLGVAPGASEEEIKRAYRKRALETHPDKGGDAAAFRAVQRAYEQALKPERRRRRAR